MSDALKQHKFVLNIIWLALCLAVGGYWMVHLTGGKIGGGPVLTKRIGYVMFVLAPVDVFFGWAWHRWSINRVSGLITPTTFQRLGPKDRQKLQQNLQTAAIVSLGFFEAVAVYGLVLSLIGCPIPYAFEMLAGLGLLMLILYRVQGYHEVFELLERLDTQRPVI